MVESSLKYNLSIYCCHGSASSVDPSGNVHEYFKYSFLSCDISCEWCSGHDTVSIFIFTLYPLSREPYTEQTSC